MESIQVRKQKGIISWFNINKDYGEIIAVDQQIYFFQASNLCQLTSSHSIEAIQLGGAAIEVSFQPSKQVLFGRKVADHITWVEQTKKRDKQMSLPWVKGLEKPSVAAHV